MNLISAVAKPAVEHASGLSGRWRLESQLESQLGMPLHPLQVPQPSNASIVEDFEKFDVYCSATFDRPKPLFHQYKGLVKYNAYQDNLQEMRDFEGPLKAGQDAGLTLQESVAIFGYTAQDYHFINSIGRGVDEVIFHPEDNDKVVCNISSAQAQPYITVLTTALDKLPPAQPGTLWRGTGWVTDHDFEIGFVKNLGAFTSTTKTFFTALTYATSALWVIESHTSAKDISNFSRFENEDEVLFPMGTRVEIVGCSPTSLNSAQQQLVDEIRDEGRSTDIICMKETNLPPTPVCVDDVNWSDDAGNHCWDVADPDWCRDYGQEDFPESGKGDDACCACKGGSVHADMGIAV